MSDAPTVPPVVCSRSCAQQWKKVGAGTASVALRLWHAARYCLFQSTVGRLISVVCPPMLLQISVACYSEFRRRMENTKVARLAAASSRFFDQCDAETKTTVVGAASLDNDTNSKPTSSPAKPDTSNPAKPDASSSKPTGGTVSATDIDGAAPSLAPSSADGGVTPAPTSGEGTADAPSSGGAEVDPTTPMPPEETGETPADPPAEEEPMEEEPVPELPIADDVSAPTGAEAPSLADAPLSTPVPAPAPAPVDAPAPAPEPEGLPIPEPVEVLSSAVTRVKYVAAALVGAMMLLL